MTTILAIDTATDACSVALYSNGEYRDCYEVIPRQHSRRLLPMLRQLLPSGKLRDSAVDAVAYSSGPGSFTGLRIGASAVQGLAYAAKLPAIPISTLDCLVYTALREGILSEGMQIISTLDANMGEFYSAQYKVVDSGIVRLSPDSVCKPQQFHTVDVAAPMLLIGSGAIYAQQMAPEIRSRVSVLAAGLLPSARDLIPLALRAFARGETQNAAQVAPVYVREEISWKKIAEQGKRP